MFDVLRHASVAVCLYRETARRKDEVMAAAAGDFEIEDAPSSFKSEAWQHFGFPKSTNEKGENITTGDELHK